MPLWNYQSGTHGIKRLRRWGKLKLVAMHLSRIARKSRPQLSTDTQIELLTKKLEDRLLQLKADVANGAFR